jgi:hypothetical protein
VVCYVIIHKDINTYFTRGETIRERRMSTHSRKSSSKALGTSRTTRMRQQDNEKRRRRITGMMYDGGHLSC